MKVSTWMSLMLFPFLGLSVAAFAQSYPFLTVDIHEQTNFTATQKAKLQKAISIFETVVNSEEFQKEILAFRTKTSTGKFELGFYQSGGKTNEQILGAIYAGTESFYKETRYNPPSGNAIADFFLSIYNGKRGVVGYTNKGFRRIHLNSYYYNSYSVEYITGNLIHEWMHKLGFSHDSSPTSRRPYSVPYGIGGIMRTLAKSLE